MRSQRREVTKGQNNERKFNGMYYSIRVVDTWGQPYPGIDMSLAVMKMSAPPVIISRTGQAPEYPTSSDPITVTIRTNQVRSVEERVYLRWSNDWFITSHIIEASPGSDGVTYTATIPPQPDGNSCPYTVLTSIVDLTGYTGSGIIDDLTLAVNGIFNALPTPPRASPTPTLMGRRHDCRDIRKAIQKLPAARLQLPHCRKEQSQS
jgi:hypothetical protein